MLKSVNLKMDRMAYRGGLKILNVEQNCLFFGVRCADFGLNVCLHMPFLAIIRYYHYY